MMTKFRLPLYGILWLAFGPWATAHSDLSTKYRELSGLPEKLANLALQQAPAGKEKNDVMDLTADFANLGIPIPQEGSILYTPGALVCHLDPKAHQQVTEILDALYHYDHLIASCRMYVKLLKPMPPEERLKTVLRIGYLPDPLLMQLVGELHGLRRLPRTQPPDPFQQTATPVVIPLTDKDKARINELEALVTKLLDISLKRLEEQLVLLP
ncbi:MAG: hypothetical protein KF712_19480 [Akkermansiaceae bacterium]|nr:hypothetical protein [Akkermansiaceae bacterium]